MCSYLCWNLSCGLCGDPDDDGDISFEQYRRPLLDSSHRGDATDDQSNPTQQTMLMPPKKQVNTSNMLGLGIRDVNEDYTIGDLLGEGAFGVVRRCRNRRTGGEFACKTVVKNQLRRRADVEDVRREVQILMMLSSHPNIAALVAIYEDEEAVHLVLELCEGGEIFDYICASENYSERDAAKIFQKMVEVVHHCHTLGIAHRDIKPENFLLDKPGRDGTIKAADFGLSQFVRPGRNFKSLVGSAYYVAPEVLYRNYGPKADVWSLGVCLYILLSGLTPFWGSTEEEIFDMIMHAEIDFESPPWPSLSRPAKDIVKRALQRDPDRRPTAQQLLQHQWLCQAVSDAPIGDDVVSRVRSFAAMTKVKRAAMLVAAANLEQDGMPTTLAQHGKGDVPGSSRSSARFKKKEHAAAERDWQADDERTGGLASEQVAAALAENTTERDDFILRLFKTFDALGTGNVSMDQVHTVLSKYGISKEDVADVFMNEIKDPRKLIGDGNGDGRSDRNDKNVLTLERFKEWMLHNTDSMQEAVRRRWHTLEESPQKRPRETEGLNDEGEL